MESKSPIDPRKTPCRYGFIGLGVMGWGMAYNLRSFVPSSSRLTICEISEERREQWVLQAPGPVYVGKTPKAVAQNSVGWLLSHGGLITKCSNRMLSSQCYLKDLTCGMSSRIQKRGFWQQSQSS